MADGASTSIKSHFFKNKQKDMMKKATGIRSKQAKSKQETSFGEMQVAALKMGKHLQQKYNDLSNETTKNIVIYTRQLPKDMWSDDVVETIFQAQMSQHFNISNSGVLERMYQVAAHRDRDPKLKVEQYADLICLFLSSNNKSKVDFAFDCYDHHREDYITKKEVGYMVSPMLSLVLDETEELYEQKINFVVNTLFEVIDTNKNGRIERHEFHDLVDNDVLMRECLGQCLPDSTYLETFRKKIVNRTDTDVAGMFRNERRRSLRGPDLSKVQKSIFKTEYPNINLELL